MIRAALLALLLSAAAASGMERTPGYRPMRLIATVQPTYPAFASFHKMNAMVIGSVTVGADGRVRRSEVVSGPPMFRQSAIAAVNRWVFRPAMRNGTPVAGSTLVQITFRVD